MGLIQWVKSKLDALDRRANDWVERTAPERARRAEELKANIAKLEEDLKQSKSRR